MIPNTTHGLWGASGFSGDRHEPEVIEWTLQIVGGGQARVRWSKYLRKPGWVVVFGAYEKQRGQWATAEAAMKAAEAKLLPIIATFVKQLCKARR